MVALPNPFPFLSNNKVKRVKDSRDVSKDYLDLYYQMEKSFLSLREVKENEVIAGVIAKITEKEIFVDFGYKDFIYVDKPKKSNVSTDLKVGDVIDVLITEISNTSIYY